MDRTTWVAMGTRSVCWLAAMGLAGCPTPPVVDVDTSMADRDGSVVDANRDGAVLPPRCDDTGQIGAHCRSAMCVASASCLTVASSTIQVAYALRQAGAPDPMHDGYLLPQPTTVPADDAPFNAVAGGICALRCDPAVADTCGMCSTCSGDLTQMPLVAQFGGAATLLDPAMGPQGLCRLDCTWNAADASPECPDQMACDAFSGVCIEACTNDNECNANIAASYDGEVLTTIERTHPRHCNTVTGRCEAMGSATAQVGDHCEGDQDCAAGSGVCLNGGHCAAFGCPTPNTVTSTCGGTSGHAGICLTASVTSHPTSICLLGCNTVNDCGPGNICNIIHDSTGAVVMIGTFTGYCIGTCESDDQCLATEACTDTATSNGRCVPRCTGVGLVGAASGGCADAELCEADHTGASYGHCVPSDHFCGEGGTVGLPAASIECPTGWVCDEMLAGLPGVPEAFGDGHCAPACTMDGDCGTGTTCVTTGQFTGLCRHACTAPGDCAGTETCNMGWCVER